MPRSRRLSATSAAMCSERCRERPLGLATTRPARGPGSRYPLRDAILPSGWNGRGKGWHAPMTVVQTSRMERRESLTPTIFAPDVRRGETSGLNVGARSPTTAGRNRALLGGKRADS